MSDTPTVCEKLYEALEEAQGNSELVAEIQALIDKNCGGASVNSGGGPNTPPKKPD